MSPFSTIFLPFKAITFSIQPDLLSTNDFILASEVRLGQRTVILLSAEITIATVFLSDLTIAYSIFKFKPHLDAQLAVDPSFDKNINAVVGTYKINLFTFLALFYISNLY